MRILFLLTQDLESPSGLGRYWPLARYLAAMGHQIEIAAPHSSFKALQQRRFERDGVKVSYVAQMHIRRDGNQVRYFSAPQLLSVTALAFATLTRAALASSADIIHVAKAQPMNGLAGALAARLKRRRLYLDCDDYEAASNRFGSAWQQRIVRGFEDWLPGVARGVTVNTDFLRQRCIGLGVLAERIRVVPNGFDPGRFAPLPPAARDAVRRQWAAGDRPVVLYLGTLNLANHPILLLLDAFAGVVRRLPSALLVLAGAGADFERLQLAVRDRQLESCVLLPGRIDPAHAAAVYAASDVLVDPVEDDPIAQARSPLKIVEALACGVPVVTGAVGDRHAMLGQGEAGILVRPGDAAALAEGILSILTHPEAAAGWRERARLASRPYRWDLLARQFASVYDH